ncbi:nucleoside deaminase [Sporosarcina siberiensis]|uniref:Nucleoside deaminase n=1 Tax=Sporosarcina siberiensis TaxID=1365606 RepID=A0ABW4SE93_9BACL
MNHEKWLQETISMAIENVNNGGGPFAAIVVQNGKVIGKGTNLVHLNNDPSSHAELLAIKEACQALASTDLSDCVLYASGEPCPMCLGVAYSTTVGQIYYACSKTDAYNETSFGIPVSPFYSDQNKAPEQRTVPFIHFETEDALAPFHKWKQKQ